MNPSRPSAVTIRPAVKADAAGVAAIYNHYVDHGGATFDIEHWTIAQAADYMHSTPPDVWLVAETETKSANQPQILGWASARRYSLRGGYRHTCETAVYLGPTALGSGVANQLQLAIDDHCRQHRLHHAVAKIIADNDRSIAFHRRHGYRMVGTQNEIGYIDGKWVDVVIMQKIFSFSGEDHGSR